jgi:hypothetical protein
VLTIEPFVRLTKVQREEVVAEAEGLLRTLAGASASYDIRFGTVAA